MAALIQCHWPDFNGFAADIMPALYALSATYARAFKADDGSTLDEDDDGGEFWGSRLRFVVTETSPVAIQVERLDEDTGTYTIAVVEWESLDRVAEVAQEASVGETYSVGLSGTGHRWFALRLPAGRYAVEAMPEGLVDPQIGIFNEADFSFLGGDDDSGGGLASRLTFATDEPLDAYVLLESLNGEGSVSFSVSRLPLPSEVAEPAEPGMVLRGSLEDGTDKWWIVTVEAGVEYVFETIPADGTYMLMELCAADGETVLDEDDDGGDYPFGSRIAHTAAEDGFVFVRVFGYDARAAQFNLTIDRR